MAAGLPVYIALFGRDTLTASWQAGLLGTEMMRGTLSAIAAVQGNQVNDWRDEQPGEDDPSGRDRPFGDIEF